jgi:hypothetical protein
MNWEGPPKAVARGIQRQPRGCCRDQSVTVYNGSLPRSDLPEKTPAPCFAKSRIKPPKLLKLRRSGRAK